MRISRPFPSCFRTPARQDSRVSQSAGRIGVLSLALCVGTLSAAAPASASGPTERMVQLLARAEDPDYVVLRYALAAEGYLFSRDGGRTFKASCSNAIEPSLRRLYSSGVTGIAPTLLDGQGRVVLGQIDGLWSDDGTGCTWSSDAALKDKWVASLLNDPAKPEELLAVVTTNVSDAEGNTTQATGDFLRRDATGKWTTVAPVIAPEPKLFLYAGRVVGTKTADGSRLYLTMNQARGTFDAPARWSVLASDDGGKTWRDSGELPAAQHDLTLLAVDPLDSKRLLAVVQSNSMGDQLLLSSDEGKTFTSYGTYGVISGVAFGPAGELYVGDSKPEGGVWAAPRMGEKLERIANTGEVFCIGAAPEPGKLRVCQGRGFGVLDIATGVYDEAQTFSDVAALLDCSSAGIDLKSVCEAQLNSGPSWCCTGHFPETEFCGGYDISKVGQKTVYCGLEGRRYDAANRTPRGDAGMAMSMADAGARDAGAETRDAGSAPGAAKPDAEASDDDGKAPASKSKDDGCALAPGRSSESAPWSALAGLSVLALALGRSRAKRRASSGPARTRKER